MMKTSEEEGPKPGINMSRVVSVESPDYASAKPLAASEDSSSREMEMEMEDNSGTPTATLRTIQSPMDTLRISMVSPFRNFLGLLKPPPLPGAVAGASMHNFSDPESPRESLDSVESLDSGTLTLNGGAETPREGQLHKKNVVLVAFDATVKEVSHAGIVWAMEHLLKRGDVLAIVSVLDSVRGALGYRVKIGDLKWVSANQKLIEEEVQQKMEIWRTFPGLDRRCGDGGVTLTVTVKAAQRSELAIVKEATKLAACHVVLDKSWNNRHRRFFLQSLTCNCTRMRRSGGVDVILPSTDINTTIMSKPRTAKLTESSPRSPTSVIPGASSASTTPHPPLPPLLSYGDQIDEFEITLRARKPKRLLLKMKLPTVQAPPLTSHPHEEFHAPLTSTELQLKDAELQLKSEEFRTLTTSAMRASSSINQSTTTSTTTTASATSATLAHERSSSISQSTTTTTASQTSAISATSTHEYSSSNSQSTTTAASLTSACEFPSSLSTPSSPENDRDDDLFSICHGSTRHTDIDIDIFASPTTSGYESDDLFSIGNTSARRPSLPRDQHPHIPSHSHSHSHSHSISSIPDTQMRGSELVITEPLRQATISRVTFVAGVADAVTLTLRTPLHPGEGLLVGSSPASLFLMHADHDQQVHRSATLSTATPNSYIAMEGKMAMKLSFLEPGQGVLAVDSLGRCRTIRVENAGVHKKQLVLVEAQCGERRHGVLLHHADTVGIRHGHNQGRSHGHSQSWDGVAAKALKVGDRVLLRLRSAEPSHAIWSS